MFRRSLLRLTVFLAVFGFVAASVGLHAQQNDSKWGRKYKTPPPSSRIEVTIVKDDNGKPVENAAVIFHPVEGDRDKGSLELKSNEDGKAVIDVIPVGDTVRLQVIANGFQTYGQDYKVDKAEMSMQVRLKRPGAQYSIYKDHGPAASSGNKPSDQPPASGDKSSDSGNQSNSGNQSSAKPDQSQAQSK